MLFVGNKFWIKFILLFLVDFRPLVSLGVQIKIAPIPILFIEGNKELPLKWIEPDHHNNLS